MKIGDAIQKDPHCFVYILLFVCPAMFEAEVQFEPGPRLLAVWCLLLGYSHAQCEFIFSFYCNS